MFVVQAPVHTAKKWYGIVTVNKYSAVAKRATQ